MWILLLFLNGYIIEVDAFVTHDQCQDKVRIYNTAAKRADSKIMVWCEKRPRT